METGLLVVILYLITPIIGLMWLGMRRERQRIELTYKDSLQMLNTIAMSRRNRR